jgi:hypothetical protein
MATYMALITVYIDAETDQEAFDKYCASEWSLDGHDLFKYDEDGNEIAVDESELN